MADTSAPDISVVIAAHNVEQYIERAIRSALTQADVTVEVIVVNDASRDKTLQAASALDDPRVSIIDLPTNAGPSVARNAGFAAATAPWIAVLDGDDAFAPGRLARCLAKGTLAHADIIIDNLETVCESDGARAPMFPPQQFGRMAQLNLARFIGWNLLLFRSSSLGYVKPIFSTAFLQQHRLRYDPDIRIGEDYLLLAEALAVGAHCAVEASAGYLYTVRTGSISHRLMPADVERMIAADQRFLSTHVLAGRALWAQRLRSFTLCEALGFTRLVEALKRHDCGAALTIIAHRPSALLHLWAPVWVHVKRVFGFKA